jgi:hypothetical protein
MNPLISINDNSSSEGVMKPAEVTTELSCQFVISAQNDDMQYDPDQSSDRIKLFLNETESYVKMAQGRVEQDKDDVEIVTEVKLEESPTDEFKFAVLDKPVSLAKLKAKVWSGVEGTQSRKGVKEDTEKIDKYWLPVYEDCKKTSGQTMCFAMWPGQNQHNHDEEGTRCYDEEHEHACEVIVALKVVENIDHLTF